MQKPPEEFGRFMSRVPAPVVFLALPFETLWKHARVGTLRVGDAAPPSNVEKVDKRERFLFSTLHHQLRGVLLFGSYACPLFRGGFPPLKNLAQKYKGGFVFSGKDPPAGKEVKCNCQI